MRKKLKKDICSSSKLFRATIKIILPNEVWRHAKHNLNGILQCDERMLDRKKFFHAPDFSLIPLINHMHVEMLGVRIRSHVEAMLELFGLNIGVGFARKDACKEKGCEFRPTSHMVIIVKRSAR